MVKIPKMSKQQLDKYARECNKANTIYNGIVTDYSYRASTDIEVLITSEGEGLDIIFVCPHCGKRIQTVWLFPDTPMFIEECMFCKNPLYFPPRGNNGL